ncbi:MAG: anaerobic ribonucleoside-triphosphate reductase activating protein [Lachnospiraceae bacterium]
MRYHNITKDDMLNGDGLRVVLWVAGCNHHCPECQNPVTWDIEGGLPFDENALAEIEEQLSQDYISGITLSGGDPLHPANRKDIGELVEKLHRKFPQKTIWLYTGYLWEEIKDLSFLPLIDIVVDGPFIKALKDNQLEWKGSSNQKVIDVKQTFKKGTMILHA